MKTIYPAIVHNEDDGLWIEFPDLPGYYTQGDDIEELLNNAEEALGAFLAVKMDYAEKIPKASKIEDIKTSETKTYISTDINKYHKDTKAVKKMISIPAWLVNEAEKEKLSLSKVLQEALKEKLGIA